MATGDIYDRLLQKKAKLALVGLGYVGLPLALAFAKVVPVIGFDIDEEKLAKLRKGEDPSGEVEAECFEGSDIEFTSSQERLGEAGFYIVAVPTPIDRSNNPDLKPLLEATATVGRVMKKGDYVVYESTVYPGCTEEECVPILERLSGLKEGEDFKYGYSPERINPGDKLHRLDNTIKIVSGCDGTALETIAKVYGLVVKAGVHRTGSIKVAEAAKIIENTQRDVNIALMNELSIIFSRIGVNTYEVLEAAGTKWNFQRYSPGLVGGHCIGVDPYYLVHKAAEKKYHPQIISAGRFINDTMGGYIAKRVVKEIISAGKSSVGSRVLVMGMTFKENVSDIRNSKVVDIVKEMKEYGCVVEVVDPRADRDQVWQEYGIRLKETPGQDYDAIVVAVCHREYMELSEDYFCSMASPGAVLVDVKGIYRGKIGRLRYWSL